MRTCPPEHLPVLSTHHSQLTGGGPAHSHKSRGALYKIIVTMIFGRFGCDAAGDLSVVPRSPSCCERTSAGLSPCLWSPDPISLLRCVPSEEHSKSWFRCHYPLRLRWPVTVTNSWSWSPEILSWRSWDFFSKHFRNARLISTRVGPWWVTVLQEFNLDSLRSNVGIFQMNVYFYSSRISPWLPRSTFGALVINKVVGILKTNISLPTLGLISSSFVHAPL